MRFNTWLITWGNALRFMRHHIKFLWLQSGFVTKVWGSLWSNQEGFQICYNKKARRLHLSLKCHRLILQNQNDKRNTIGKLILRSWSLYKQTKKYFLLKFYYSFSTLYSLLPLRVPYVSKLIYLTAWKFKCSAGSKLHVHLGQPFHFIKYSVPCH